MPTVTTSDAFGDYAANIALQAVYLPTAATVRYLALHLSDPRGAAPNEMAGLGYHRQPVSFSSPSGRRTANTAAVAFTDLPAATVRYLAVWSDTSAGQLLGVIALGTSALAVPQSGLIRMTPGDVAFAL